MNPPYRFDGYRDALGGNWYEDDALLHRLLRRHAPAEADAARETLSSFGSWVAGEMRALADENDRAEFLPRLRAKDAYDRAQGEIELPDHTRRLFDGVHGRGLAGGRFPPMIQSALGYLSGQNGEAGVLCSLVCTDGLFRALTVLGETDLHRRIRREIADNRPGRIVHGAQFVTEVQGGSDAATNTLEARPQPDGGYELWGDKWFCSNATADWWAITARPAGSAPGPRGVGLFVAPRRWEGAPNGYRIDRLKDKLGTRALPTVEMRFEGTRAWPLGPLDRGLKNMVGIILVTSRVANAQAGAALLRRAAREVQSYTAFREAFGQRLADMPLVAHTVADLRAHADRAAAGVFELIARFLETFAPPIEGDRHPKTGAGPAARAAQARVLISLAKAVATAAATEGVHEAMMLLGGNGIEERFSALPRLWRDAVIFETWEGPHNLLIMQAHEDLRRFGFGERPAAFLDGLVDEDHGGRELAAELGRLLARPEDPGALAAFKDWCGRCYRAFEDTSLARVAG